MVPVSPWAFGAGGGDNAAGLVFIWALLLGFSAFSSVVAQAPGATSRVSVATGDAQANGLSDWASISADGRYIAFDSDASNLVRVIMAPV